MIFVLISAFLTGMVFGGFSVWDERSVKLDRCHERYGAARLETEVLKEQLKYCQKSKP